MNAPHHPNVEKILAATDWDLEPLYWQEYRNVEHKRVQDAYERTQAAWNKQARNEVEANMQMQAFKPPYQRYDDIKPAGLSVRQVLIGCGVSLAVITGIAMAVLNFYR